MQILVWQINEVILFKQTANRQQSQISQSIFPCFLTLKPSCSEDNNMLNDYMKLVHSKVHESLGDKSTEFIKKKAQSLGIRNNQFFHKERWIFLIAQHIAYHIDLHIQESKRSIKSSSSSCNINSILKKRNQILDQNNNRNHSIQFTKATFLHHYICGPFDIFKSVRLIQELETQLLSQYEVQEITLEAFKQNERITQLSNQRQFSCMCKYEDNQESIRCQKCMKKFHPQCQFQKLVCNRCYLTHYFYPIDNSFFSKFGEKRKTSTYFHSKFRCSNPNDQRKSLLFAIKFDIDDFQDLKNAAQPQFTIKIMNFKSFGLQEEKTQKWRDLNQKSHDYSIFLNFNRFEFFLNFFQLRKKHLYFRDENSLIFKLQNRMPKSKDNILMIKCDPHFFQDQTYQIGIYRVSKIKNMKQTQKSFEQQFEMINENDDKQIEKSIRITQDQYKILQNFFKDEKKKPQQNVKFQMQKIKKDQEDDNDQQDQKYHKLELVRSYGCNHKEGFGLAELKKNHLKFMEISRQAHRNKDLQNQIKKIIQRQLVKQYKKHTLGSNIKTQQNLPMNQQHLQSISRYCIDNDLFQFLDIPEFQNFQKKIVDDEIKKYIQKYQIKNLKNKKISKIDRKQACKKEQKKYRKFAKCPICQRFLSALYLLPYEQKQGQQMKISKPYRSIKKKKIKMSDQEAQQLLTQMFRPRSIFHLNRNKKEEESESEENQYEQQNQYDEQINQQNDRQLQNIKVLLSDQDHKQVFENSLKSHKIYISKNTETYRLKSSQHSQKIRLNNQFLFQKGNIKLQQILQKQKYLQKKQDFNENATQKNQDKFKVMSEQSSSEQVIQDLRIQQEKLLKVSDSQYCEQLSFDSPIINYLQSDAKPIINQKSQLNSFSLNNIHQYPAENRVEFPQQNKKEKSQQIFQISDIQEQSFQNYQTNQNIRIDSTHLNKQIDWKKYSLQQKKQPQQNLIIPPKEIIEISLLSEDQQQQGQMKI